MYRLYFILESHLAAMEVVIHPLLNKLAILLYLSMMLLELVTTHEFTCQQMVRFFPIDPVQKNVILEGVLAKIFHANA